MRALLPSEVRTVGVAAALLGAVGLYLLVSFMFEQHQAQQRALVDARRQLEEARSWMKSKDVWLERKRWLDAAQPVITGDGATHASEFRTMLRARAESRGLTVAAEKILDPKPQALFTEVGVSMRVVGRLEDVIRWIVESQQPHHFQAVTRLAMVNDKKDITLVQCDIDFARFCTQAGGSP